MRAKQRKAVGQEPFFGDHTPQFLGRDPPEFGDFPIAGLDLAVVTHLVAAPDQADLGVAVWPARDRQGLGPDARLFPQFASRRIVVGLSGGNHPTEGDVPPAGPDVLVFAASVDEHPVRGVTHEDEHRAMPQHVAAHHRPRNRVDHPIVDVDDVDKFCVTALGHGKSVARWRHVG